MSQTPAKLKAAVLLSFSPSQKAMLSEFSGRVDFEYRDPQARDVLEDFDIIIGNPRRSLAKRATRLKWVQLFTAGADLYLGGILDSSVLLTNASGAYGERQSEFMLAGLLALCNKYHLYRDNQTASIWNNEGERRTLDGATALIIGYGDIGAAFAKRLKAFGTYVIGVRKSNLTPSEYADEIHLENKLEELLPRADIVTMLVPYSRDSKHILNERAFSLFKPGAMLLNAGRGATVDTEALCRALNEQRLSGAVLDVFEEEPLSADHELWGMKNVILTPHVAGWNYTPFTDDKIFSIIIENMRNYLSGAPLRNLVEVY